MVAVPQVTYHCSPGFDLVGRANRYCQADGTWTPVELPICVRESASPAGLERSIVGGTPAGARRQLSFCSWRPMSALDIDPGRHSIGLHPLRPSGPAGGQCLSRNC